MGSLTLRHIHGRHRICTVNIMDFDYVNGMPSSTTRVFANTALILGFAFQVMGANYGMAWSVAAFPNGGPMVKAAILFSIFATISGLLAIVPMIMGIVSSKRVVLVTGLAMLFQMIHMALVSADQGASTVAASTLVREGKLSTLFHDTMSACAAANNCLNDCCTQTEMPGVGLVFMLMGNNGNNG